MTLPPALEALDAVAAFVEDNGYCQAINDAYRGPAPKDPCGTCEFCQAKASLATLREALAPARFRVSVGDHHAEIQVSQTAPAAYHQGMVETVVAEAMRRALAARPLRWTREKPTTDGWYWMLAPNAEPEVGEVVLSGHAWLYLPADGGVDRPIQLEDMPWAQWAGPLPEPGPATEGA